MNKDMCNEHISLYMRIWILSPLPKLRETTTLVENTYLCNHKGKMEKKIIK